jgi:hypothetical protein
MTKLTNVLHIYAQPYWHQCAFVVGDREALVKLREQIDAAIQGGPGKSETWFESFTNDGEGFETHVVCVTEDQAEKLMLPYTDEPGDRPQPQGVLGPYDLVSHAHRTRDKE